MALAKCSYCNERNSPKYAQATWAWQLSDQNRTRVSYRQRLCPTCASVLVLALDRPSEPGANLTCPSCGIDTEEDFDAVYVTVYYPGYGPTRYEFPMCAAHAVEVRNRAMQGAWVPEDRLLGAESQAPNTDASRDPWAALGLVPRD